MLSDRGRYIFHATDRLLITLPDSFSKLAHHTKIFFFSPNYIDVCRYRWSKFELFSFSAGSFGRDVYLPKDNNLVMKETFGNLVCVVETVQLKFRCR